MQGLKDALEKDIVKIVTNSEEETRILGKRLVNELKLKEKPQIIVLTGNLGTGKTKLTEGILSEYGYEDQISSPTFTIVNEYLDYQDEEKPHIYHFDVYRLENFDEFYDMGGDEYFGKGLCIVEWGEIIKEALPKEYLHITIEKDLEDYSKRNIIMELKK